MVYALQDPRTQRIRYVGLTGQPLRHRVGNHMGPQSLAKASRLAAWLRDLASVRLRPMAIVLEDVSRFPHGSHLFVDRDRRARAIEREWIRYLLWLGADLLNIMHVLPRSPEARARHSAAMRAVWQKHYARHGARRLLPPCRPSS